MAKSSSSSTSSSSSMTTAIKPQDYAHSPVHYAVSLGDQKTLIRIVSTLPRLIDPTLIQTESDSLSQERLADHISSVLDRRDVPNRETPLHLAVRLNDSSAARILASAGPDVSLQNSAGWNPLQEAVCRRCSEIALTLLRLHHRSAWEKWRRRLPRLLAVLRRMRDFYMEISFHFESSIVPFVGKIAPSDTYRIWKRDGNLRADTSLAGFDGLKIQRSDQTFLFLGDADQVPSGSLIVLNHNERKIFDAFENAGAPMTESDIAGFCSQTSVYRPGMDVTKAELVGRTNWRRQERTESVGEWKAKVYEIHNVVFSFRSRKVSSSEQILPLELEEDSEDGFLVAEIPTSDRRRHSSFVRQDRDFISNGRKSFDFIPPPPRPPQVVAEKNRSSGNPNTVNTGTTTKEREYVKSLRPSVWLTEQFPLRTEEILPLLDILANKVKAVRRLRELLTTKFPPGTFPVKVAIPVVPTVRVVITFTKFVELQPIEQFFTPLSSPTLFTEEQNQKQNKPKQHNSFSSSSSSSSSSWLRRTNSTKPNQRPSTAFDQADPFTIPSDYTWTSIEDKNPKIKKSKSIRKGK